MGVAALLLVVVSAMQLKVEHARKHDHHLRATLRHGQHKANATHLLDPYCHTGVMDDTMTACCQADCGECSDASPVCKGAATNGRGSTCCPTQMLGEELVSCEVAMPPCKVPASVRAPASVGAPSAAVADCNKVVQNTRMNNHLSTAFIKFEKKTIGASTDCATTYGTNEQAAAACSKSDTCMGFATSREDPPVPGCLFVAGLVVEELTDSSDDLLLKREDGHAGHTFKFEPKGEFGACSVSCGGGTKSGTLKCETTAGVSVKLGMCTSLAAMNADASPKVPEGEIACNEFDCDEVDHPLGNCAEQLEGCIHDLYSEYYCREEWTSSYGYSYGGCYYYDQEFGEHDWQTWTVCPSGLQLGTSWGRVYPSDVLGKSTGEADEDGTLTYDGGIYYETSYYTDPKGGHMPVGPTHLTFACGNTTTFARNAVAGEVIQRSWTSSYSGNTYTWDYYAWDHFDSVVYHPCAC